MPCTIELSNEKREAQLKELKAAKSRLQKEFEELSAELSMYVMLSKTYEKNTQILQYNTNNKKCL